MLIKSADACLIVFTTRIQLFWSDPDPDPGFFSLYKSNFGAIISFISGMVYTKKVLYCDPWKNTPRIRIRPKNPGPDPTKITGSGSEQNTCIRIRAKYLDPDPSKLPGFGSFLCPCGE